MVSILSADYLGNNLCCAQNYDRDFNEKVLIKTGGWSKQSTFDFCWCEHLFVYNEGSSIVLNNLIADWKY